MKKFKVIFFSLLFLSLIVYAISSDLKDIAKVNDNTASINNTNSGNQARNLFNETILDTNIKVSTNGFIGFPETVDEIMAREKQEIRDTTKREFIMREEFEVDRENLPQNPASPKISRYPFSGVTNKNKIESGDNPQTVSTNFTAATVLGTNPTNAVPPDDMGAVGLTQFIVAVNGRIVTFNKSTGIADGVLNTTTNTFFTSVRNASGTSDPRIRYDRLTQRWFVVIINVSTPNRILISVSNTATITGSTVWTFYYIDIASTPPTISTTCLADYPTLGIDANALYIGTNNFCGSPSQTFNSTDGYVVKKSTILTGTLNVTVFRALMSSPTYSGPFTPQGVDNFDPAATEGYFIGVDGATYGTLMIRRVSTPGGTPTISSNISLTVPTTYSPYSVRHLGNTGSGTYGGKLDPLDDRLFAAQMRNGRLWTSHNINVDNTGVASSTESRDGCRWYEIQNLTSTPALVQSGTVYTPNTTNTVNDRNYFIPTVNISGQGHVAMTFSTAGTNEYANAGTLGRLSSDALGTMQTSVLFTSSSTAYNPAFDLGSTRPRRWGDYTYVSVDPEDDMTMWIVSQFCDATNSYGVRAAKLLAPLPATPSSVSPSSVLNTGLSSVVVVVTGTSVSGSGFFDPGAGFAKHISASVTGNVTVNSVTYNSPTQVTLNLNTVSAVGGSNLNLTITNPDGQSITANNFFQTASALNLGLTAMLSGYCNGTTMNYAKNITVELHNQTTPYALVESKSISLSTSGVGNPTYTTAVNGTPYYIVLKLDNGLETWSATPQSFSGSVLSYDFTTAANKAYGSNQVFVGSKYCIISGDVDQDGSVGALDRSACWNDRNLVGSYVTDLDGDGSVGALDRSVCWNNRNLAVQKPALAASPKNEVNKDTKKNTSKGKNDLKLDGSNAKKVIKKK